MEEIRKQTAKRIAEFFNGESTNAENDTYKKLLDFEKEVIKAITVTRCCKSDSELLKVGKVKEFWQFKNSYLIDKQLNKDPFGFRKDLTDSELVDKYALYLKNNL